MICGKRRKMNPDILELIHKLKRATLPNDFFRELKNFFDFFYEELFLDIIKVTAFPPYYFPILETSNFEELIKVFSDSTNVLKKENFIILKNYYLYPLEKNDKNETIILIFDEQILEHFDDVKFYCDLINGIYILVLNNIRTAQNEISVFNANLISQISHDINSLTTLLKTENQKMKDSISDKINYTEKMAKDILQYVRDIQILESEVNISELLHSIINSFIVPDHIKIIKKFDLKTVTISVDVELLNQAIHEILKNSISAIGNQGGQITVSANIKQSRNFLFQNKYIEIIIDDSGKGINPDFLEFLKNPFFTTQKSEFHSGLGLSIADNIINVHGGKLDFHLIRNNHVSVIISLPIKRKNNV